MLAVFLATLAISNVDALRQEIDRLDSVAQRDAALRSYIDACSSTGMIKSAREAYFSIKNRTLKQEISIEFAQNRSASETTQAFKQLCDANSEDTNTERWGHLVRIGGFLVDPDGQPVPESVTFDKPRVNPPEFPMSLLARREFVVFSAVTARRNGPESLMRVLKGVPPDQPSRKVLVLDVLKECLARDVRPPADDVSVFFEFESERLAIQHLLQSQELKDRWSGDGRDLRRELRLIRPVVGTPSAGWWFVDACNLESQRENPFGSQLILKEAESLGLFNERYEYRAGPTTYGGNALRRAMALCVEEARSGDLINAIDHLEPLRLPAELKNQAMESMAAAYASTREDLSQLLPKIINPESRVRLQIGGLRLAPQVQTKWSAPELFYGFVTQAELVCHEIRRNDTHQVNLCHAAVVLPSDLLNDLIQRMSEDRLRLLQLLWSIPESRASDIAHDLLLKLLSSDDDDEVLLAARLSIWRDDLLSLTKQSLSERTKSQDKETQYAALSLLISLMGRNIEMDMRGSDNVSDDSEIRLMWKLLLGGDYEFSSVVNTKNSWLLRVAREDKGVD